MRYFTGRITSPTVYASSSEEGHTYRASGPSWFLENLRYFESRYMAQDPTTVDSPLVPVFSPRAVLFNTLDGVSQTTGEQIAAALAFANTRGANISIGAIGLDSPAPWEEASSISVMEVLRRSARWSPDAVMWWDYSTAKPAFHVQRREDLDAMSIDLNLGDLVVELRDMEPMDQARPPGVRFFYEDIVKQPDGTTRARYVNQSAGNPDLVLGINEVIELGGQGGTNPEPIPADLATSYWNAVKVLNYSGKLILKARDVTGEVTIGMTINILNGKPEWQEMAATIQATSEDLFSGVMEVDFGQPTFLGASAFVEWIRYSRVRAKTNYIDARRTGEGVTSAVPPSSINFNGGAGTGKGLVELQVCGDPSAVPPVLPFKIKVFAETIEEA